MGVLQRFERRLGGLVDNVFPKVFKGGVEPVEIAGALARETDERRVSQRDSRGRTISLAPNQFSVELASQDFTRLEQWTEPLCHELEQMVREHGSEQGYTFIGPVTVRLSEARDLDVGIFRIRGWRDEVPGPPPVDRPARGGAGAGPRRNTGAARLLITNKEAPPGHEREHPLTAESTLLGRSTECDIRLTDAGVSRQHGLIEKLPDGGYLYKDAGSTNGSLVNGRRAQQTKLADGDVIELGSAIITFRSDDARPAGRGGAEPDEFGRRPSPRPGGAPADRYGRAPGGDRYADGPPARRDSAPPPPGVRDRSGPRGEPFRGERTGPRAPYADRSGARGEPLRDRTGPRGEPYRDPDRSGPRGEPYRDPDRSGPRGEPLREDRSGPREPFREADRPGPRGEPPYGDRSGPRSARPRDDARDPRRRDGDSDRYRSPGGGYGDVRRGDGSGPRPAMNGRGPGRAAREDEEIYDAETHLPSRSSARPRSDDFRRRPGGVPPSDRSW